MWISELFLSKQGEGLLTGTPSVFVRTSGCNLRCWFCDTPYTSWSPEGQERSVESIISEVVAYACDHVVLTGGEPMLVPDVVTLSKELASRGKHITIETAGTVDRDVHADLMSISPKLANSSPIGTDWEQRHEGRRHRPEVIAALTARYEYQLKFVVDNPADINEIECYLQQFPDVGPKRVLLMPQGTEVETLAGKSDWIESEANNRGWRFSPRMHIEWYGNTRGT